MERILAQEEISELISALRNGDLATDSKSESFPAKKNVTPFNLVHGSGTGWYPFGNFDVILDNFARSLSIALTSRLQNSIMVKLAGIENLEFEPLMQQLSDDGVIGIISLHPLSSSGLFVLNGKLSYTIVEIMLGGTIRENFEPLTRSLTAIEQDVVRVVLEDICRELKRAFLPLEKIQSSLDSIEVNPKMVNIVGPSTEIIEAKFDVTVADSVCSMEFVIPRFTMEPLREKLLEGPLTAVAQTQKISWVGQLKEELNNVETEVIIQSGEVAMPIEKILNLQVGDVIELDYDINRPLRLLVGENVKFYASPGVNNVKKAVQITGCVT